MLADSPTYGPADETRMLLRDDGSASSSRMILVVAAGSLGVPEITIAAVDEWTRLALAARGGADRHALEDFVQATQEDVWRLCAHLGDRERARRPHPGELRSGTALPAGVPRRCSGAVVAVPHRPAGRGRRHRLPAAHAAPAGGPPPGASGHHVAPDHQGSVTPRAPARLVSIPSAALRSCSPSCSGYSYAEAAEACCVPIGTIRSRVARARGVLVVLVGEPAALVH